MSVLLATRGRVSPCCSPCVFACPARVLRKQRNLTPLTDRRDAIRVRRESHSPRHNRVPGNASSLSLLPPGCGCGVGVELSTRRVASPRLALTQIPHSQRNTPSRDNNNNNEPDEQRLE